jgi:raffinose/stachyose/melibiose transport system permease protein
MNRYTVGVGIREGIMILLALIFLSPVYVMLNLALGGSQTNPLLPVTHLTFSNFTEAWAEGALGSAFLTSFIVTAASVVIVVVLASFAAYPLARVTSRLSRSAFFVIMAGLTIPYFIAMVPFYQTIHQIGLLGSPLSLIILYSGHQFPLSVFLYTTFLRGLPIEYEEAAALDGCSSFQVFTKVVFPLLRPVTATVVVLNVIAIWNDFLIPLLFLGTGTSRTLPVAIYEFVGDYTAQWPLIFAGVTISILPLLIVYFVLQKRVMTGFGSGIKG